jgi:hypothetical protein
VIEAYSLAAKDAKDAKEKHNQDVRNEHMERDCRDGSIVLDFPCVLCGKALGSFWERLLEM